MRFIGQRELAGDDRGPDPVAGLPARGVRQADDAETRQSIGHMDLHRDGMAPDADESGGSDGGEHGGLLQWGSEAVVCQLLSLVAGG